MKILTTNFVTCAVKACKTSPDSFPLHFKDAELEQVEMEYNPLFLRNILARIEWDALKTTAAELGFTTLPDEKPDPSTAPVPASSLEQQEQQGEEDRDEGEGSEQQQQEEQRQREPQPAASMADTEMSDQPTAPAAPAAAVADSSPENERLWRDLHTLLLETSVIEGRLVCGNCGHEYRIKEGIANFLLPNHLV